MMQAGAATVLGWAIDAVRKGGNVSVVGVYGPPWNLVPIGVAMNKGVTMRAAQCNVKRYMPHLLEHVRSGRVNPRKVISHHMPLEQVSRAYEMFARKENQVRKIVLTM
jgi:threonine dehydrogenase-like Zn-dependent dehydrogenase